SVFGNKLSYCILGECVDATPIFADDCGDERIVRYPIIEESEGVGHSQRAVEDADITRQRG
uniref:Uncharacterized protein n=1 Tax=Panagrolaimus sp. ES5 TaxID=591445 RepID=A0AC34GFM4_9BILA